jgi:DNA (cytosine-5)-methyltransferase 1
MIISDFESIGYKVKAEVLNAADFGVPQLRRRVFIIGVRGDIDYAYNYPQPAYSADDSDGLPQWIGVGEALSALPDPDLPNNLPNHDYSKYKLRFNGYIGHRAIDPLKPAPTVTARGDDKGGVVVLHHPNNRRRMSCRELATVQSFPVEYVFCGTRSSVYRQIGNAVPPLLAYAVAKQFNEYTGQ